MINVSDEFREVLANGGQLYMTVDVEYADGTTDTWNDEIMQGQNTIVDGADSATFPMGVAIEKYMTLCIDNRYDEFADKSLYMAVLRPKISLELDETPIPSDPDFVGTAIVGSAKTSHKTSPRVETVRRGKFTITTPETYGEVINITAVDDMYKADQTYYTNYTLPQSMYTLVREACDICGIAMGFSSMTHGGYIVNTIPDDITFRTFFAYAAMIECANARIDIYGNLQFVKWDFHSYKGPSAVVGKAIVGAAEVGDDGSSFTLPRYIHQIEDFKNSPTFSSDDVVVTGVVVKTRKEKYQFGNDGYVLEFENLLAEDGTEDLATIATWLGEKLIGAAFRTMTGDVYADPTIEFGDSALSYRYVASLDETREYFTPITDVSFYLQGYTTIKTQAKDPIRLSAEYNTEAARALSEAKALTDEQVAMLEEAIGDETQARIEAIETEQQTRVEEIEAERDARIQAILDEAAAREEGLTEEEQARIQAILEETTARKEALSAETEARIQAILDEAAAREAADEQERQERIAAIQSVEEATNAAIDRLAERLAESSGLYMTVETQPDGSSVYYMHNKPTLAESDIIWKLTAEAFAISTDYGETYPYGFTVDGEVITRILSTEGINASWINAGSIIIKNEDNKVIFMADMDTESVYMGDTTITNMTINGDSLFYGSVVTTSGELTSQLTGGALDVYYGDSWVGSFHSSVWQDEPEKRGLTINARDAAYLGFSYHYYTAEDGTSVSEVIYLINLDISDKDYRHEFVGDAYFAGDVLILTLDVKYGLTVGSKLTAQSVYATGVITSDSNITAEGNVYAKSRVFSYGDIYASQGATIYGGAVLSGGVELRGGVEIYGGLTVHGGLTY